MVVFRSSDPIPAQQAKVQSSIHSEQREQFQALAIFTIIIMIVIKLTYRLMCSFMPLPGFSLIQTDETKDEEKLTKKANQIFPSYC